MDGRSSPSLSGGVHGGGTMMIKICLMLMMLASSSWADEAVDSGPPVFRFHIFTDPMSLSPLKVEAAFNSYLHGNLYGGLMVMNPKDETSVSLEPHLAKSCVYRAPKLIECELRTGLKWANGKSITREDFIRPFRDAFAANSSPQPKADLVSLLNAKAVLAKKMTPSQLGVFPHPTDKNKIIFHFEKPDADFLFKLASPVFAPRPAKFENDEALARDFATGPYRLKEWKRGTHFLMEPNPHYFAAPKDIPLEQRPQVKAIIVGEDSTAFKLYQTNELDFLRRVPAEHHRAIQNSPELHRTPFVRMDYLGFSNRLKNQPALREAIVHAINYEEFKSLFFARGRPGCFGISSSLYEGEPPCYEFDVAKAKKALARVDAEFLKEPIDFYYNLQGGDDILKAVQFFENQLKKHLKLKINIQGLETTQMRDRLATNPPDIFRRGVPVATPSCMGAVEVFSKGSPDNFTGFEMDTSKWDILALPLAPDDKKRAACTAILNQILSKHVLIPLGEQHFMIMVKKKFSGWQLNALNQLNLSGLRAAPITP